MIRWADLATCASCGMTMVIVGAKCVDPSTRQADLIRRTLGAHLPMVERLSWEVPTDHQCQPTPKWLRG